MCYLKPLKIVNIKGQKVTLENGIKAYYDKSIGEINLNDQVLVYGNLIVDKVKSDDKN